jgi:radical SAM superfamily enzyme YgiQ (UPF0313 family)
MTPLIKTAARLAGVVKEIDQDIVTIVGGPHVSALPARTLAEFPTFDLGVVGEGESTLADICAAIQRGERTLRGIAGTVYRADGAPDLGPERPMIMNLDELPFPARDLIDFSLYTAARAPGYRPNCATSPSCSTAAAVRCAVSSAVRTSRTATRYAFARRGTCSTKCVNVCRPTASTLHHRR